MQLGATAATTDFTGRVVLIEASRNYMVFSGEYSTSTSLTKRNGDALTGTGNTLSLFAEIPIAGWGAQAILGQDADTRIVAARARLTTAQTAVASKVIPFNSLTRDTHVAFNTTTGVYTVPVAGQYRVSAGMLIGALDGTTDARIQIRKNSTIVTDSYCTRLTGGSTTAGSGTVSDILDCVAGDTIDIFAQGDASFDIDNNGNRTFVAIDRLSGPAQIAASEYVGLAVNTTATAITGTSADIVFTNRVLDTHNAYNTSTGVWTCPATATYVINGAIFSSGTFGLDTRVNCEIQIGGVNIAAALNRAGGAVTNMGSGVAVATRRILAGQQVKLRGASQATTPAIVADATLTYFNITKVGI
jgi:hypothetical protein